MRLFSSPRVCVLAAATVFAAAMIAAPSADAAATSYSGQAKPLSVSALGASVSVGDTGALPSSGGSQSASLTDVTLPQGLGEAALLKGTTSGSGSSSTSTAQVAHLSVLSLISADAVKSTSTASCSGTTPSVSGSSQLVGVTILGQSVSAPAPNTSISLPGGISAVLNQQTSSVSGSTGSITVNAIHVTGPGIDVVVGSAESDITC